MATKRRKGLAPLTWPAWFQRLRAAHMALGVGLVVVAILLYANLASSERKVEHPIAHQYAASDSQFVRTMGSLLGPSFVAGNHVTALLNGDEVFPAMLGAIRAVKQCQECHEVKRGKLLGAFSYELFRDPATPVEKVPPLPEA